MRICLWNIDCPEHGTSNFNQIKKLLSSGGFDQIIIIEGNSAMPLHGYQITQSATIPYFKKGRNYKYPNNYAQVIVYTINDSRTIVIEESINNVVVNLTNGLRILANVITIKDKWADSSSLVFSDRLNQQMDLIKRVITDNFIVLGDFNFKLRKSKPSIESSYSKFDRFLKEVGLIWATSNQRRTVQHIVHSKNIILSYEIVETGRLSDHPMVIIEIV